MNIKELSTGQTFTADFTQGTEYVVDAISTDGPMTVVTYHIVSPYASEGVKPYRGRTVKPALTTVYVKE